MKHEDAEEYTQALGQVVAGGWRQIALGKRLGVPKALRLSVEEWVQQRLGGYLRLSVSDRQEAVKTLATEGESQRGISKVLGVARGTVQRDLETGPNGSPLKKSPEISKENDEVENATGPFGPPPLDVLASLAVNEEAQKIHAVKKARQLREEEREKRRQENAEKVRHVSDPKELLKFGRFSTIVIDPPWDLDDEGDVNQMGRAKQDYASIPLEELLLLPVDALSDEHCHLYLWITNRSLPKGFRLMEAWGFRYVTAITWVKPSFGMGNYFRGQTEHILFGIKGSLKLKRADVGTAFHADRGARGHSSKPPEFFQLIESCSPGPYLSMYERESRSGWISWGEISDAN